MVGIMFILGMLKGVWRNRMGAESGYGCYDAGSGAEVSLVVVERIVDGGDGPCSDLTNMDLGVI